MGTFLAMLKEDYAISPIPNPIEGAEETAMVVLTSISGKSMIGSVGEIRSGITEVFYPLVYVENVVQDPNNKQIQGVTPVMGNGYHILGLLDWQFIFVESMYLLRADRTRDKQLVQEYEKAITVVRANDVGLVTPGPGNPPLDPNARLKPV